MTEPTSLPAPQSAAARQAGKSVTVARVRFAQEKPVCRDGHGTGRRGIAYPSCGCRHFHVLYTRRSIGGRILRRRECRNCERRVTTYEKVDG